MRAGNLNKKVEIQSLTSTQNEFGEVTNANWTKYKNAYASVIPVSGKESFLSNTDFSKTSHKIRIRYLPNINASMRIVWNNRVFNFISTRNIAEMSKEIEILAEEVNNGN